MRISRNIMAAAFLTLALSSFSFAQQQKDKPARRLQSITWNPAEHKLTWTVSDGKVDNGKFVEKAKTSYEIDMDAATMNTNGEARRFSRQEAVSVHALMDLVAKYAAESTLWWDAGEGEPMDGGSTPGDSKSGDSKSKVKRDESGDSLEDIVPERPRRRDNTPQPLRISFEQ